MGAGMGQGAMAREPRGRVGTGALLVPSELSSHCPFQGHPRGTPLRRLRSSSSSSWGPSSVPYQLALSQTTEAASLPPPPTAKFLLKDVFESLKDQGADLKKVSGLLHAPGQIGSGVCPWEVCSGFVPQCFSHRRSTPNLQASGRREVKRGDSGRVE